MNGPEHYAEAERLVGVVRDGEAGDTMLTVVELLANAQVHATLALAAATIDSAQSLANNIGGGGPLAHVYDGYDAEAKQSKNRPSPWAEATA